MKKIFLLLLFVLGFLLVPNNAMACRSESVKNTSHKEMSSKMDKDHSCCKSSHSKNKKHNCGDGKCGHSKCVCTSFCSLFLFFSEIKASATTVDIVTTKQKFPNFLNLLSSGYRLLWLIPKIG